MAVSSPFETGNGGYQGGLLKTIKPDARGARCTAAHFTF
jgi:hypothetical protein